MRIIRMKELATKVGLGRSSIYERLDANNPRFDSTFPKPIHLGAAAVGWLESDVDAWLEARIAASRGEQAVDREAA
ncbi:helix-turn-helix transcriptional regulator [Burkholderia ambifaria]|uniref:helix-turn-helix transcriptional regulator n=1 Tax=Burkholderia ambifaria TaxID=152480 RepID=UPI003D15F56D